MADKPAPALTRRPEAPPPPASAEPPRYDDSTPPATTLRGPTPDEVLADPLVRTVLDVFEGEVKRIHPRPKRPNQ